MRNPRQPLIPPAIHLNPTQLVVRESQPLVAPGAGADGVRVPSAGGCRVHAELADDVAGGAETEGTDVAGDVGGVGAGGGEEVVVAVREEDDVGAVELFL